MSKKIDFVLTWVDGSDPEWLREKNKWQNGGQKALDNSSTDNRYRDWDLLRYWFRGVEKFAPWVNRIFFVTCGQKPDWLNEQAPKLVLVDHKDFIPEEYLPTFNSSTIEMNIHRIPGLSEHFVNFNDDMFLTDHVKRSDFFKKGKACEPAIFSVISPETSSDVFVHCLVNNLGILNDHFSKKEVIKKYPGMFYSLKYGKTLLKNLYLTPSSYFNGFKDAHLPSPYVKRYFNEVWDKEGEILHKGCLNRFRSKDDHNEWLVKNWQVCSGASTPRSLKWGHCYQLGVDEGYCEAIKNHTYKAICINDSYADRFDFETEQKALKESFQSLLPDKSRFEL